MKYDQKKEILWRRQYKEVEDKSYTGSLQKLFNKTNVATTASVRNKARKGSQSLESADMRIEFSILAAFESLKHLTPLI